MKKEITLDVIQKARELFNEWNQPIFIYYDKQADKIHVEPLTSYKYKLNDKGILEIAIYDNSEPNKIPLLISNSDWYVFKFWKHI